MPFEDENNEFEIKYPVTSLEYINSENNYYDIEMIAPILQNQIENLNDLLIVQDFDLYSPFLDRFIQLELVYIEDNYINIHNIEEIINNDIQRRIIFIYLYELLTQDLIKKILPKILENNGYDAEDLLLLDQETFKEELFQVLKYYNDLHGILDSNIDNESVKFESVKFTFYLDLFDTDLTKFQENVIQDLVMKYEDEIEMYCDIL